MSSRLRLRTTALCAGAIGATFALSAAANGDHHHGDDHGDGPRTATVLGLGAPAAGSLGSASDIDVFRFDLVGQTEVEIRTSGQADTAGELTDSAAMSLAADDNSGAGDNFSIRENLGPGVYYVHVTASEAGATSQGDGTGSYAIDVRTIGEADDLHGDTLESSTLLRLLSEEEAKAVTPSVLLSTAGRIFPTADDVDVFRIDVPYNATQVMIRAAGSANANGSLVDSADMEIMADTGDGNFRINTTLGAGIYYLKVSAVSRGAYRVLAQYSGGRDTDDGHDASTDGDRDGDGVPNNLDAFPDDPNESVDADANGVGDNAQPIAMAYAYDNAFGAGSSVSYTGQTARQLLIAGLKREIGTLTDDRIGEEEEVRDLLRFYVEGSDAGSDDAPHGFTVSGGEPVIPGPNYGDISTGKNLWGKIAGGDGKGGGETTRLIDDFFGWEDGLDAGSLPINLVDLYIENLVTEATDGNSPQIPTVDGQVSLDVAYVDAHGLDYQQLLQKFLGGAVSFSQGTNDYFQTDWANYLTQLDGKTYTGAEHKFDEAFGYYGATRNMNEYSDDEAAAKGGRDGWSGGYHDTNGDGQIDVRSEVVLGHAQNCAKRDRGSNGSTNYSKEAMDAFLLGRQIVSNAATSAALDDEPLTALYDQIAIAAKVWEKCIAATVVHYINDVDADMGMYQAPNFADLANFKNVAKHWGEMKGFALGLQFSPFSPFRDGSATGIDLDDLKRVHTLMGDAPVLADGSQGGVAAADDAQSAIDAYRSDLMEARDILKQAYGFDSTVVESW